ncbi:FecR domain-containing protein [Roseateles sp. DC23W]|uniref:FecR domain-containing protein n=1 Tax=Pelomonas dachongensis TaxID=3299029 RepID=A0ABW7EVY4_9BURK
MTADHAGTSRDAALPHAALAQAADWFALLRSGEATPADQARWHDWLAAGAAHREAWARVERISLRFVPLRDSHDPQATVGALATARQRRATRRHVLRSVSWLAGGSVAGWMAWRCTELPLLAAHWTADHRAAGSELASRVLADGSRIWLAPGAALKLHFGTQIRRMQLLAGQLFVDTAPDAHRRFIVDTPQGRLRALGTRFHVRMLADDRATLAVYDGAVELRTAGSAAATVVQAGQQRNFDAHTLDGVTPADPNGHAWTRGILLAQDMSLGDVLTEVARYRPGHLAVAPEVAGLRVHGSFPLANTDRALAMLAGVLPIRLRQPLPWWTAVEARR